MNKLKYYLYRTISIIPNIFRLSNVYININKGKHTKLNSPYILINVNINEYSYIGANSNIANTSIGKFCSIGANFSCGGGIHPIDALSTSPYFYSKLGQCGISISPNNKIEEYKEVKIGNDVFIGVNVTILGGVSIGNGAIIGAGAVVSKDIPPYAIAVGCPIKIIRYRFDEEKISLLQKIQWWNFHSNKHYLVEENLFDVEQFIKIMQDEYINLKK